MKLHNNIICAQNLTIWLIPSQEEEELVVVVVAAAAAAAAAIVNTSTVHVQLRVGGSWASLSLISEKQRYNSD